MDRKEYAGVYGFIRAPHGDHPSARTFGGYSLVGVETPSPSEELYT
jgi:hypothetical protein